MATDIVIAGYYISSMGERSDTVHDLIYEIAKGCLNHAGIEREHVDALVHSNHDWLDGKGISSLHVVDGLGGNLKEESKVADDGIFALYYAFLRIKSGLAESVLVAAYGIPSESNPRLYHKLTFEPFYLRPLGFDDRLGAAVLVEALKEKGADFPVEEGYELIKLMVERGNKTAFSHRKSFPSFDEYVNSNPVVGHLREWDFPPDSDGGIAVLLCTEDFVRKHNLKPLATIRGWGLSTDTHWPGIKIENPLKSFRESFEKALNSAGVKAGDLSLIEFSEPCSYLTGPMAEAAGLVEAGKGNEEIIAGKIPVNVSGGNTAACPTGTPGLLRVAAILELLKSASSGTKAAAHGWTGPLMQLNAAVILEKV